MRNTTRSDSFQQVEALDEKSKRLRKVAIVGGGPKALYTLERLLANLAVVEERPPVEINFFFSAKDFGVGDIYNVNQPDYLLMNYGNGFISSWSTDDPQPVVSDPLSMSEWLAQKYGGDKDQYNDEISPRKMVGQYLKYCFRALEEYGPENVVLVPIRGEVTNVYPLGKDNVGIQWRTRSSHIKRASQFEKVILATGHVTALPAAAKFSNTVSFIYPVNTKLKSIETDSVVAIKGMGLTFIDAVLALTEGRGGKFVENNNGLTYLPSGKEPRVIYPFSKSGLPMMPRHKTYTEKKPETVFFTTEKIEALINAKRKVSFENDLLPLIKRECRLAYYQAYFQKYDEALSFLDESDLELQIENFHYRHPQSKPFNWETFVDPLKNQIGNRNVLIHTLLTRQIIESEKETSKSPLSAACSVWRAISPLFNEVYSFGKLDSQSHQQFDEVYAGVFNRLSYGPPTINAKKILALTQYGLLDFSFSQAPGFNQSISHMVLESGESNVEIDWLIDARIPKIKLQHQASTLYQTMLSNGVLKLFVNKSDGKSYGPGCLDVTNNGATKQIDGIVNENIAVYGTPLEGITFDNDTLSTKRNNIGAIWAKRTVQKLCSK